MGIGWKWMEMGMGTRGRTGGNRSEDEDGMETEWGWVEEGGYRDCNGVEMGQGVHKDKGGNRSGNGDWMWTGTGMG